MEGQVDTEMTENCNNSLNKGGDDFFSYHQEMTKIEELGRFLKNTQHRLNMASMRSHLLNVDMVTQFDPHRAEKLHKTSQDCQDCIQRMKEREKNIKLELELVQNDTLITSNEIEPVEKME